MTARLSTCGRCGGTIERRPGAVAGWGHVTETPRNADGHLPDPDDSYASPGPASVCEWCAANEDDPDCEDACRCPDCENERALQDDADAHFDRVNDR